MARAGTNGTRWRQDDRTKEYIDRERAKVGLLWNQRTGTHYLDVEGKFGVVRVVEDRRMERMGGGGTF